MKEKGKENNIKLLKFVAYWFNAKLARNKSDTMRDTWNYLLDKIYLLKVELKKMYNLKSNFPNHLIHEKNFLIDI